MTTFAAPPIVFVDNPLSGKSESGIITFYGWAVGPTGTIRNVSVSLDDNTEKFEVAYGGPRGDVGAAFPGIPGSDQSGFSFALNTRLLPNGVHRINVEAQDANGETTVTSVSFLVSNAPGDENPTTVQIDLTGAQLRVVGPTEILVEGLRVNGQSLVTVLKFDPNSNHFIMPNFVDDSQRTGFRDDDLNRDGFSDKDLDRDGFPDDDLNRDGLSDNGNENENTNSNSNENDNTNTNTNTNTNANTNENENENTNSNKNTNTNPYGHTKTNTSYY